MNTPVEIPNKARTLSGVVVSDRMSKTAVVKVERRLRHPVYGKFITRSTKLHVHDEKNECNIGDKVHIAEVRPISKHKSWALLRINVKARNVEEFKGEKADGAEPESDVADGDKS